MGYLRSERPGCSLCFADKTMSTVIDAAEAHTEQIGLIVHGLASLKGAMAQWRDTAQNARLAEDL